MNQEVALALLEEVGLAVDDIAGTGLETDQQNDCAVILMDMRNYRSWMASRGSHVQSGPTADTRTFRSTR